MKPGRDHSVALRRICVAAVAALAMTAAMLWGPVRSSEAFSLKAAARRIGPEDALVVAPVGGPVLFSKNENRPLIPASTLKLLTALAAFEILGTEYRFPTDFFLDAEGNLIIKGYGDPLLISEVVDRICTVLAKKVPSIADLVLDDTFFADPILIPGVTDSFEPYDAPNGALCVNFNTVDFQRTAGGGIVSAEPQTPLLPMVLKRIERSGLDRGRIVLPGKGQEPLLYAGHLFAYFLRQNGVAVTGRIRSGIVSPDKDRLILRFESPFTLQDAVSRLLEYSNNFMANQILIAAGAHRFGPPGNLDKASRAAREFARRELSISGLNLEEGSGISRKNRITASGMLAILDRFAPYRHLMAGQGPLFYKTGTLSGIQTRAGYIETPRALYRFAILINTPGKEAEPIVKELVKALP